MTREQELEAMAAWEAMHGIKRWTFDDVIERNNSMAEAFRKARGRGSKRGNRNQMLAQRAKMTANR